MSSGKGRLSDAERARGLFWKFRAGAPMAGTPAVGPHGETYLGTTEGYVHALDGAGRFEWSFTLDSAVMGTLAVGARGNIHAVTHGGTLYTLKPGGTLAWKVRAPAQPDTGLVVTPSGTLVFAAADGSVHGVSSGGRRLWRYELDGPLQAGPSVASWGAVLFAGRHSLVIREDARTRHVAWFPEPMSTDPLGWDGEVYAVTSRGLVALSREGSRRWTLPGVRYVGPSPGGVVAVRAHDLAWVDRDGVVSRQVPLEHEASAEPCVDRQGTVFVPTVEGLLLRVTSGAVVAEPLPVAGSALLRPICPEVGLMAVVAAAEDGTVVAVRPTDSVESLPPRPKPR